MKRNVVIPRASFRSSQLISQIVCTTRGNTTNPRYATSAAEMRTGVHDLHHCPNRIAIGSAGCRLASCSDTGDNANGTLYANAFIDAMLTPRRRCFWCCGPRQIDVGTGGCLWRLGSDGVEFRRLPDVRVAKRKNAECNRSLCLEDTIRHGHCRCGINIAGQPQANYRPGSRKNPYRRVTKHGTAGVQENHHTSQG